MNQNRKQSHGEIYLVYNMKCMYCTGGLFVIEVWRQSLIDCAMLGLNFSQTVVDTLHWAAHQWSLNVVTHSSHAITLLFINKQFVSWHANFGRLFDGLRQVRFSFCKNLLKGREPYCKTGLIHDRKISRTARFSRKSRNFPARENFLFYSIIAKNLAKPMRLVTKY